MNAAVYEPVAKIPFLVIDLVLVIGDCLLEIYLYVSLCFFSMIHRDFLHTYDRQDSWIACPYLCLRKKHELLRRGFE